MLILTRRVGEAVLIDGGIRIVVLGTDGGGVRLGIEAPASVGIVREEVLRRTSEEEVGGEEGCEGGEGRQSARGDTGRARRGEDASPRQGG
jgi:carbon storage regulator